MVFFHNINPGARVQVKWRGEIESGTIRYAGSLVAKDGDWVGVELDNAGNVAVNTNPKTKFCIAHFFGSKYMFFPRQDVRYRGDESFSGYILSYETEHLKELVFCLRAPKSAWK